MTIISGSSRTGINVASNMLKEGESAAQTRYCEWRVVDADHCPQWLEQRIMSMATGTIYSCYQLRLPDLYRISKKPETLKEAIDRIVAEEVQKLDAWGKHPRYRKQPMSTPANKEVLAGTAEKDWNDDSAKGEQPYGQKIGNSDPFEKVVDLVLDGIKSRLQEGKKSKKA
jgi:hypothetical protein